jgi:hypothetical protein
MVTTLFIIEVWRVCHLRSPSLPPTKKSVLSIAYQSEDSLANNYINFNSFAISLGVLYCSLDARDIGLLCDFYGGVISASLIRGIYLGPLRLAATLHGLLAPRLT